MIRWILVLLVLANALAWFWFSSQQQARMRHTSDKFTQPAAEAPDIRLLSELTPMQRTGLNKYETRPPVAEEPPPETVVETKPVPAAKPRLGCRVVGPVETELQAAQLNQRLIDAGIKADIGTREVDGGTDYWVYLAPSGSAAAATALLQELQEKNIDSYIFPVGDFENGISLGVFASRENAIRQQSAIKKQGYEAKIHEVRRKVARYWLYFPAPPGSPAPTIPSLESFAEQIVPRYLEKPCETVASADQFQ